MLLDSEGRCVLLEFPAFILIGVYCPANRDETRVQFRSAFMEALDARIRNLVAEGKEVILTGDLNVIGSEIDTSNLEEALRKDGTTIEEWISTPTRRLFNQLLFGGTVHGPRDEGREQPVMWDICRYFHPQRSAMFTCWDTKRNTRPANLGSRIDYVLCSDGLKDWFIESNIQEGLMGSDHCPVYGTMSETVKRNGTEVPLEQLMNPPSMFVDGKRVREWETRDALAMSAKLIPEFDRRQNIRDMFTRKSSQLQPQTQTLGQSQSQTQDSQTSVPEIATEAASGATTPTAAAGINDSFGAMTSSYLGNTQNTASLEPGNLEKASPAKRSAVTAEASAPPTKKTKGPGSGSTAGTSGAKAKAANGQRTLQGFFKPKNAPAGASTGAPTGAGTDGRTEPQTQSPAAGSRQTPPPASTTPNGAALQDKTAPTKLATPQTATPARGTSAKDFATGASPEKVFDPIENKESWSKLLGKRVVPRCEHDEPCISLLTKKPGVNCGKWPDWPTCCIEMGRWLTRRNRTVVLHLPTAPWPIRRKRKGNGVAMWDVYME